MFKLSNTKSFVQKLIVISLIIIAFLGVISFIVDIVAAIDVIKGEVVSAYTVSTLGTDAYFVIFRHLGGDYEIFTNRNQVQFLKFNSGSLQQIIINGYIQELVVSDPKYPNWMPFHRNILLKL